MTVVKRLLRRYSRPLREYLDWRFDRLEAIVAHEEPAREDPMARVDVSRHNASATRPMFARLVSQVVSAAQFEEEDFVRWSTLLASPLGEFHRKVWEHCYILRAAEQHGVLRAGNRAIGFGVGSEPIPAALARHALHVLASDLDPALDEAAGWMRTGEHMSGLDALSFPDIVDDAVLARLVSTRFVDMRAIPADLGPADLVWSAGAFEHLGSPEAGFEFVLNTLDLLGPGGVAVHTTELELVPHESTRDHGMLAVYRPDDLDDLVAQIRDRAYEIECNWSVSLDTPRDRIVLTGPFTNDDPVHLKIAVADSILTSVGIIVRRPT